MSCPNPDLTCAECIEQLCDEHPGAETFKHTYHWCDCPVIAVVGEEEFCVGCREPRDIVIEYEKGWVKA